MLERVMLALLLVGLGYVVYLATLRIHQRRLQRVVRPRSQPVLLYFRNDHCPPCAVQSRYLEQLPASVTGQIEVRKVDTEQQSELASSYGVFTVPTTILLDGQGTVREINYGLTNSARLMRQMESVL